MASSFRDLKKSREAMFEQLNKQIEQGNKKGGGRPEADPRFWYPQTDQAGNGFAIIRFLPAAPNEAVPYITEFAHGFQGPGGWYIQRSRTTLGKGEKDPVYEYNGKIYAQSKEAEAQGNTTLAKSLQESNKRRRRTTSYIANILVVKDPANPENEGKVFLFRYGIKLQTKIEEKMKPAFEGDTPINPFDPWEGANLRLKITTAKPIPPAKKGFRNYDNSEWDSQSAIGSDAEIEAIWKSEHPLLPLIAPDTFEPYEKLKAMFDRVMGFDKQRMQDEEVAPAREERSAQPDMSRFVTQEETVAKADLPWNAGPESSDGIPSDPEEEDADLAHFRKLAGMVD